MFSEDVVLGEVEVVEVVMGNVDEYYMFGIMFDQFDVIYELFDSFCVYGDVVNCSGEVEFVDGILLVIGDVIY